MASLSVTVAAYGSLPAACADWDQIAAFPTAELNVLDAALIERSDDRVSTVHRHAAVGWAQGSVASAVVGTLAPPALLDGALAGGVGRHLLTFVFHGLSRDAKNELGRVLESGPFVSVTVLDRAAQPTTIAYGGRALVVATLPMRGTTFALRQAFEADEADI